MPSANERTIEVRRVARLGLMIAAAGALHFVETLLPTPLPWFRLGVANAVVLVALHRWGWRDAAWVAIGKVLLGALLTGRFLSPAFFLSAGGTFSAVAVMALAIRCAPPLGLVGVSVLGAEAHAAAQLGIAALILLRTATVWALAPLLGALAVAAGVLTGFLAAAVVRGIEAEAGPLSPTS